jgi:hypothetical protein
VRAGGREGGEGRVRVRVREREREERERERKRDIVGSFGGWYVRGKEVREERTNEALSY